MRQRRRVRPSALPLIKSNSVRNLLESNVANCDMRNQVLIACAVGLYPAGLRFRGSVTPRYRCDISDTT
jgi:hypothetical protein